MKRVVLKIHNRGPAETKTHRLVNVNVRIGMIRSIAIFLGDEKLTFCNLLINVNLKSGERKMRRIAPIVRNLCLRTCV